MHFNENVIRVIKEELIHVNWKGFVEHDFGYDEVSEWRGAASNSASSLARLND